MTNSLRWSGDDFEKLREASTPSQCFVQPLRSFSAFCVALRFCTALRPRASRSRFAAIPLCSSCITAVCFTARHSWMCREFPWMNMTRRSWSGKGKNELDTICVCGARASTNASFVHLLSTFSASSLSAIVRGQCASQRSDEALSCAPLGPVFCVLQRTRQMRRTWSALGACLLFARCLLFALVCARAMPCARAKLCVVMLRALCSRALLHARHILPATHYPLATLRIRTTPLALDTAAPRVAGGTRDRRTGASTTGHACAARGSSSNTPTALTFPQSVPQHRLARER